MSIVIKNPAKFVKLFKKAPNPQKARQYAAYWVEASFVRIVLKAKASKNEYRKVILEVVAESQKLCSRPITDSGLALCSDWFKEVIAQYAPNEGSLGLFRDLGWGWEEYLNPKPTDTTTVEMFHFFTCAGSSPVKCSLKNLGHIPEWSVFVNNRSGLEWRVLEVKGEMVELEIVPDRSRLMPIIFRTKKQLMKNFRKDVTR